MMKAISGEDGGRAYSCCACGEWETPLVEYQSDNEWGVDFMCLSCAEKIVETLKGEQ